MLTRLQVKGFKNLVDVDVRFGPFTCIAGANGVGKSNLFDAILFLSQLADKPFVEAASNVRGGEESPGRLFSAHGDNQMHLAAEMLIPEEGKDAFSQVAKASATLVRYELSLSLENAGKSRLQDRIRLDREQLSYIKKSDAVKSLAFPHGKEWRDSVVAAGRSAHFISTEIEKGVVNLHADRVKDPQKAKRGGGKPVSFPTATLSRTALSAAQYANETRTAVLVRNEMRSWRLLQLEPTAFRQPDNFQQIDEPMTVNGAHIPATLYRVASVEGDRTTEGRVYSNIANRLASLVEGVRSVRIDKDDTRRLLTLLMTDRYGLELPAAALSDGTMRFIALSVIQQDPTVGGVICLEEPENGIHPQRIEAILKLLNDIAVDPTIPQEDGNPLRQVIVNTHSTLVAARVADEDLIFARGRSRRIEGGKRIPETTLSCLDSTWRAKHGMETISRGEIKMYLSGSTPPDESEEEESRASRRKRRVIDRFDPDQLNLFVFSPRAQE